ncbi:hypothetical protein Gpo141_00004671 [Globisporangium polare]
MERLLPHPTPQDAADVTNPWAQPTAGCAQPLSRRRDVLSAAHSDVVYLGPAASDLLPGACDGPYEDDANQALQLELFPILMAYAGMDQQLTVR